MFYKKIFLLVLFFIVGSACLYAQPGDPGGGGNPDVPITGIEYLLGLGGLLGIKKLIRSFHHRPNR